MQNNLNVRVNQEYCSMSFGGGTLYSIDEIYNKKRKLSIKKQHIFIETP